MTRGMRRNPSAGLAGALALAVLAAVSATGPSAHADEGMWTFHDFPSAKVKARYGFSPDQAWLDKARMASARLAGICSASFVSADGLVMTNHHCAHDCVAGFSTADHDYVEHGFSAATQADEKKCPDAEIQRLDEITDVTAQVTAATRGKRGAAYTAALRAASSKIEKACQTGPGWLCQVVDLYHGGQFMLYKYKRYTDVRVVFAPEMAAAFFGGDPDNFEFPRYDLDVSFMRVYEGGKPAKTPDHFTFSPHGAKSGELTFVSGNPGSTDRERTVAQLQFERDVDMPLRIALRAEWRGQMTQFARESAENDRTITDWLFGIENALKAYKGRMAALGDEAQMKQKADAEAALRARIKADPKLAREVGDAYQAIAQAHDAFRPFYHRFYLLERIEKGDLLDDAIQLCRATAERRRPNGKRLDEYRDANLPQIEQKLASVAPIYPAREKLEIAFWLGKVREELGPDDPLVRKLLGKDTPEAVAARVVDGTKLGDPAERMRLWKGGARAIARSRDPIVLMARAIDVPARTIRRRWDDRVQGVVRAASEKIAKARFALDGRSSYPDATFTLRLSYGAVEGYTSTATGKKITPFTDFAGAFRRATGAPPFDLATSWLAARKQVNGRTHLDFVTTNDIIGGNSGSPVFDQKLQIVGLIFDGNIESLAGDFWYDEAVNRSVAVSSEALIEALSHIYHADRLVDELRPKHP
jgi:Peptidase S46